MQDGYKLNRQAGAKMDRKNPGIPAAGIIQKVSGTSTLVASLPVDAALFLVALATLLTILAGIIPARGAAKCNPVKALRAE